MNERNRSLVVFWCLASVWMSGCDEADDGPALARGEALVGVSPRAEITIEPSESNEAVARAVEEQLSIATPPATPYKKVEKPSEENVRNWLQWAMAQPDATGPITDQTGAACAVGQQGPVWFLAGNYGGSTVRECNIPAGKQLFFPLLNRWCVFPEEFYPDEESILADLPFIQELYDWDHDNTCELTLRLDGQDLMDFETMYEDLYIRLGELFELELNDQHWAEGVFAGGVMPASGAGHYGQLQPLSAGDHVLELGGTNCANGFNVDVTYLLHVGP